MFKDLCLLNRLLARLLACLLLYFSLICIHSSFDYICWLVNSDKNVVSLRPLQKKSGPNFSFFEANQISRASKIVVRFVVIHFYWASGQFNEYMCCDKTASFCFRWLAWEEHFGGERKRIDCLCRWSLEHGQVMSKSTKLDRSTRHDNLPPSIHLDHLDHIDGSCCKLGGFWSLS